MTGQNGFTLIEALTTGVLCTVLAGAILSLMNLTNGQVKAGAVQIRLSERQGVAREQIRKMVHEAHGAMMVSEDSTLVADQDKAFIVNPLTTALPEIKLFDDNNWIIGGYKLGPTYLMEGTPDIDIHHQLLSYKAFTIGNDTVYLDSARSYFRILRGRKGIIANLRYIHQPGIATDTLPMDSVFVVCRNRNWP
jgi:type II secretory pathway pseudopilin PulG